MRSASISSCGGAGPGASHDGAAPRAHNPRLSDSRRGGPTPEMAMPAVTIKADGRTPTKARRRPPRRWSRVRPAAPLDPDRRQRLEPLPAVRLRAPRLPLRPGAVRRPPPAGATTPAIASRSLLFEQIPSVFEQVASAALVTSSPGRGARQLARRRPCFPELQVELSGARRVAVAAAAVGEGSGGNRRRDSACVPRCATTSRCRRPRTPGVVGDSDEDGATLVSG